MDFQIPIVSWLNFWGVEVGDYLIFKETLEIKRVGNKGLVRVCKALSLEKAEAWCKNKTFHVINEEGQFEW